MNISRRFTLIFYRLPRFMQSLISKVVYKPKLGKNVTALGWIVYSKNVQIGDNSYINENIFIGNVQIGKFCCIAKGLSVGMGNHPFDTFSNYNMFDDLVSPFRALPTKSVQVRSDAPAVDGCVPITTIGNDVWIGMNVTLKTGISIGDGAVIGSCSMVTKDVPPYSIVAGNPARIVKKRFSQDKIELLRKLEWWNWESAKIYEKLEQLDSFDF